MLAAVSGSSVSRVCSILSMRFVVLVIDHSSGIADSSIAAAAQHRMNTPQLRMTAGHDDVATAAAVVAAAVAAGCTAVAAANGTTAAQRMA